MQTWEDGPCKIFALNDVLDLLKIELWRGSAKGHGPQGRSSPDSHFFQANPIEQHLSHTPKHEYLRRPEKLYFSKATKVRKRCFKHISAVLILCWFQASALFLFSGRNLSFSFRIFLRNQKQNFILTAFKAKERRGASNHQGMLFLTSLLFLYWISSKNYSVPLANSVFFNGF